MIIAVFTNTVIYSLFTCSTQTHGPYH